ncbi:MAG: hypothetical protein HKN26_05385 [Acidimicrobiales bacterium]|nr:hypothetical protein [Acidimicrobiales bacterium]
MSQRARRVSRRAGLGLIASVSLVAVLASPAAAHGVGGRIDLPLPAWQLAWAAGFAVAISFVALGAFWSEPRLADASTGSAMPAPLRDFGSPGVAIGRVFGLVAFGLTLAAAWFGTEAGDENLAPVALFITFWVGMQIASFLFGDVWRACNPLWTLAHAGAWVRARITRTELSPATHGEATHWPAAIAIFSFLWLELAYHSPDSPRSIAVFLTMYSVIVLMGASVFGRGWARTSEGFGVLFSKLAAMAPMYRDDEGVLRFRLPMAGLARLDMRRGTVPFILIVLGSTSFDGFTRSSWWLEIRGNRTGWEYTIVSTIGLIIVIGVVALAYGIAIALMARITGDSFGELSDRFGPSLVPIAAAYAVAHYFSLFILEGQALFALLSDPFGRGADIFGTADRDIDYSVISTTAIAWVQTVSIAIGHVFGVAVAHDRAIERWKHPLAIKSQYPMLGVMVLYTVVGLFLLLGA